MNQLRTSETASASIPAPAASAGTELDFYFDFNSPYGYFGATRIEQLAAQYGRKVHWHPLLLGAVFKVIDSRTPAETPLKRDYFWHDVERSALFHGIAYRRPSHFPFASQHASRAMLWITQQHGHETAVAFARQIFSATFEQDIDVGQPSAVLAIAAQAGVDSDALAAALETAPVKEALKAEVAQALERGVFGAPYVIVDGEPFWGFDRFEQLEAFLKNGKIQTADTRRHNAT